MKKICVFAGSSTGSDPEYAEMALRIGGMIAARSIGLVYGGGRIGLMGALAQGALAENGYVHGIIPQFLDNLEVAHRELSKLTITETMHERKSLMYEESDAFLVLPGGFGTMDELHEVITHRQINLHNKPIWIFNHNGYWDSLIVQFRNSADKNFIRPHNLNLFENADSIDAIADWLDNIM